MDQKQKRLILRLGFMLLRSFLLYLIFALFSVVAGFTIRLYNYDSLGHYTYLPDEAVCGLIVFFSLLFYYSLVRVSTVYSNGLREQFLAIWNRNNPPGFLRRVKFTFLSLEFCFDICTHSLLLLILPYEFGFEALAALLGDSGNKGPFFLILIPTLAFLCFTARLSALSAWSAQWSRKNRKPDFRKFPFWKLPVAILFIWACFIAVCVLSPIGVRSFYALFQILQLANPWVLFPVLIGAILLWYFVRFGIAICKRRRLLRRLRKFCKENGYELLNVKKCFRTLFFPCVGANFTLKKDGVQYDCRLISSMGHHSPLLFREEGTVTCTHVLRLFSLNLFHYDFTYDYQFEGEGTKILILLPAPIEVFVSGYNVTQLASSGSRIADCTIYGGTDFLNALERNVVGH